MFASSSNQDRIEDEIIVQELEIENLQETGVGVVDVVDVWSPF